MTEAERALLLAVARRVAALTEHYAMPNTSPIRALIAAVERERPEVDRVFDCPPLNTLKATSP